MRIIRKGRERFFSLAGKTRLYCLSQSRFRVQLIQVASFACLLTSICSAETFDVITRRTPAAGTEVIRIDRPNPTKRATDYPQIVFQPGDLIAIQAGGCVQSGGIGNTWHRYVDPSGGDSDRLYHGLITIPFGTGTLERIQKYQNQQVKIPAGAPPGRLHLQLGFEDDDYSGNGYTSHDNGPNDQCAGSKGGPAWVELTVVHNGNGSTTTANPPGPWDLVGTDYDDNSILLNPDWRAHVENKIFPDPATCRWPWYVAPFFNVNLPPCTSEITDTDTYAVCQTFSKNYGYGGHANWTAATYTGVVTWEEKSSPGADDEYSVNLTTADAAGGTNGKRSGVHVEFDTDETVDTLAKVFQIPWWMRFKKAVDDLDHDPYSASVFLNGLPMIVTGLIGVDFAHTPTAESHPAWDIAVHTNNNVLDDTWAFFVRNWGNEGFCSGNQHYIDYFDNEFTFRLPWEEGATRVEVIAPTLFLANQKTGAVTVSVVQGQAVLVTFHDIPDAGQYPLIGGELHMKWSIPEGPIFKHAPSSSGIKAIPGMVTAGAQPVSPERDIAETYVEQAILQMNPAQRSIYDANAPKEERIPQHAIRLQPKVVPAANRKARASRPAVRSVPDVVRTTRKNAEVEAIKKAYGGNLPGKQ